jgi:Tfp pilus assembly protein PilO
MKNIAVIIVLIAVLSALYFGYITMMGKVMHRENSQDDTLADFRTKIEQDDKIQNLRDQQKRLMEDRQQKLRDMQRR